MSARIYKEPLPSAAAAPLCLPAEILTLRLPGLFSLPLRSTGRSVVTRSETLVSHLRVGRENSPARANAILPTLSRRWGVC